MSASSAPTARAVPQLMYTGTDHLRASVSALPIWSLCSWVMTMPANGAASRPSRVSRRSTSFAEKPQSSRARVVVVPLWASTTSALPSLPLPRLANRTAASVQLCMQQRHDALRVRRRIDLPVRIDHGDLRHGVAGWAHIDEVFRALRFFRVAGKELTEQPLALHFLQGIGIADVINALLAIAIVDREVGPVERETDAQPCAVERLRQVERRLAGQLRARRGRARVGDQLLRLCVGQAEL